MSMRDIVKERILGTGEFFNYAFNRREDKSISYDRWLDKLDDEALLDVFRDVKIAEENYTDGR